MLKHLYQRYLAYEARWYAPILQPEQASNMPAWYLRYVQDMSEVERQQWRSFYQRWHGWRGILLCLSPLLLGSALALAIHMLLAPARLDLVDLLLLGNALGGSLGFALIGAWLGYRNDSRLAVRYARKDWPRWLGMRLGVGRSLLLGMLVGLGAAAGVSFFTEGYAVAMGQLLAKAPRLALAVLAASLLIWLPYRLISYFRHRQHDALMRELQASAERERLARQLSEARLRLLEAQIEPHFLFNTLGAVQQLAEDGAPRAAALTGHLIQFLRGSLAQMRAETVSLHEDFALARAYLTVMEARLGERLAFSLDLPAGLADCRVPSMMLLTLVENAIKHGIEPALRGGRITVRAGRDGDALLLSVADNGRGLHGEPVFGTGLSNVAERLQLAFGTAASVSLHASAEHACQASLRLPMAACAAP